MINFMRPFILILLIGLLTSTVRGQVSFSPVDGMLQLSNNELVYVSSTATVKFPVKRQVTVVPQSDIVTVDGQILQIMTLKFSGFDKSTTDQFFDNQKQLLDAYSQYEMKYFKNELRIDVVNPNSQWVVSRSRGWLIWYFRVGGVPIHTDEQTVVQLFATTIVGDRVFIINAPVMTGNDFSKAALIVNDMMEAMSWTSSDVRADRQK